MERWSQSWKLHFEKKWSLLKFYCFFLVCAILNILRNRFWYIWLCLKCDLFNAVHLKGTLILKKIISLKWNLLNGIFCFDFILYHYVSFNLNFIHRDWYRSCLLSLHIHSAKAPVHIPDKQFQPIPTFAGKITICLSGATTISVTTLSIMTFSIRINKTWHSA